MRLYDADTYYDYGDKYATGIPQHCKFGVWSSLCSDDYIQYNASLVLCYALGFEGNVFLCCYHIFLSGGFMTPSSRAPSLDVPSSTIFYTNFTCDGYTLDTCSTDRALDDSCFTGEKEHIITCFNLTGKEISSTNSEIDYTSGYLYHKFF